MSSDFKRPQIRRCRACQKVGHNLSTCQTNTLIKETEKKKAPLLKTASKTNKKKTPPQVNFFVHHVNQQQAESPHRVNLKTQYTSIWNEIESSAPEQTEDYFSKIYTSKSPSKEEENLGAAVENNLFHKLKKSNYLDEQVPKIAYSETEKSFLKPSSEIKNKNTPPNIAGFIYKNTRTIPKKFRELHQHIKQNFSTKKLAIVCSVIALIFIVPTSAQTYLQSITTTKNTVTEKSMNGFMALQDSTVALLSANIPGAQESTVKALNNFSSALQTLENKHRLLQKIASSIPIVNNEVASRQNILVAGQEITLGNAYLLKGFEEIQSTSTEKESFISNLAILKSHLQGALPHYQQALYALNKVDTDVLPLEFQASFKDYRKLFTSIFHDFQNLTNVSDSLLTIFGGNGMKRYLLVFQNPYELRATGGFMGSFAELDVNQGKIEKITIPPGGTYDLQGQLSKYVEPPTPLLLSNKRWEMQDANWFPDFPQSAEKILWFYRHAGRGSADGVIAINSSVLVRLLSLVGPITDTERNITLSENNALEIIQSIVEDGSEKKDHKPKQILSDLAPLFLEYIKNAHSNRDLLAILINLKDALDQKEIQAYFSNQTIQNEIDSFGWSGSIKDIEKNQDYLLVINSNIQGQKSDAKIKQKISHQALVQEDGSIIDTVAISREHTGKAGEKFYGVPNIDYMRVYVPEGSELLHADGFTWPGEQFFKAPDVWTNNDKVLSAVEKPISVDEKSGTTVVSEFKKTSFGNWVITEPGKTSVAHFSYRLPFKISLSSEQNSWFTSSKTSLAPYFLSVQKQSGSPSTFESQIIFPNGWKPVLKEGLQIELASNGAVIGEQDLKTDVSWSFAMQKK
jgi:hypothetical protein